MKSNPKQLESRGFVTEGAENAYLTTTLEQRVAMLKSSEPTTRTLGARLLAESGDAAAISYLIATLASEQKLYTKLEISRSLASFGERAVAPLVGLLGVVGDNQHTEADGKAFNKRSYPLPRDIAARTLVRIGSIALPELLKVVEDNDLTKLSEAIDAIGFICFYEPQQGIFKSLKMCFDRNAGNDLIQWKIIRAMSALPESEPFLTALLPTCGERLRTEVERSLSLLSKRTER